MMRTMSSGLSRATSRLLAGHDAQPFRFLLAPARAGFSRLCSALRAPRLLVMSEPELGPFRRLDRAVAAHHLQSQWNQDQQHAGRRSQDGSTLVPHGFSLSCSLDRSPVLTCQSTPRAAAGIHRSAGRAARPDDAPGSDDAGRLVVCVPSGTRCAVTKTATSRLALSLFLFLNNSPIRRNTAQHRARVSPAPAAVLRQAADRDGTAVFDGDRVLRRTPGHQRQIAAAGLRNAVADFHGHLERDVIVVADVGRDRQDRTGLDLLELRRRVE